MSSPPTQVRQRRHQSKPLRRVNHASPPTSMSNLTRYLTPRTSTALVLAAVIALGTAYDLFKSSAQSEMFVQLMTPSTPTPSYFANKHNILNKWFVKFAWFWTSLAFAAHFATSPPGLRKPVRVLRYALATAAFVAFTAWFFGPAMMDRVRVMSGGECVLIIPSPDEGSEGIPIPVPDTLCYSRTPITPSSHPEYFVNTPASDPPPTSFIVPRIRRGHDVSGHIFLLTLSVLFLVDQIAPSLVLLTSRGPKPKEMQRGEPHWVATVATAALVGLWVWMTLMTSVWFHTPMEKLSGFVVGVAAFAFSQLPLLFLRRESVVKQ